MLPTIFSLSLQNSHTNLVIPKIVKKVGNRSPVTLNFLTTIMTTKIMNIEKLITHSTSWIGKTKSRTVLFHTFNGPS